MQEDLENTLEIGLEETKTKSTLLSKKRLRKQLDIAEGSLDMHLNNTKIKQVRTHKLLGVEIDAHNY